MVNFFNQLRFKIRNRLARRISVSDGEFQYKFRCESPIEVWRAQTLLKKEEGTVNWIRTELRPSDVFYDIGANIGLYTLLAGKRINPSGMVYAFEPHVANVQSLLHNIALNNLNDRIRVISCALNNTDGFFDFNYCAWVSGSSMSQLNDSRDDKGRSFNPVFSELKCGVTVDRLVEDRHIRPPDLIKIDVDGNELLVLQGMERALSGTTPPRAIQVEINSRHKVDLFHFMRNHGYAMAQRHDTLAGKTKLAADIDPESISYNAVFKPTRAAGLT